MFTGIVKGIGTVEQIEKRSGLNTLTIKLPEGAREGIEIGASIAIDGVCLTVCRFTNQSASFDVMQQTLSVTTLGALTEGSRVNIERAATANAEIGGHQLSGHIDCLGKIVAIDTPENNHVFSIEISQEWKKYVFAKGYIAINGASLTVASFDKQKNIFTLWLIPETLRLTTFADKKLGDFVNIEIDRNTQVIVDSVFAFLEQHLPLGGTRDSIELASAQMISDLKRLSE